MIRLDHFSYSYQQKVVLKNIDVTLPTKSLTVVTGLSGSGKSTLCRALCGLVPHFFGGRAAGEIYLDKLPILTSKLSDIAAQVAIVLEDYESQLFSLTVGEEMTYSLALPPDEAKKRAERELTAVGLEGFFDREIASLSGGQKQRVAIAAALIREPNFIVFDEPAAALDPAGKVQLYALLNKLANSGLTVVVAEQDPRDLLLLADQVLVLEDGQIRFAGAPEEVAPEIARNSVYGQFLPDLWQLRARLGDNKIPYWRSEQDAVDYLRDYLKACEVEQSA